MKKLVIILLITMFVFTSLPAFAKTWKIEKPEDSFFNRIKNCVSSFGKTSKGEPILEVKSKPSSLTADEIKELGLGDLIKANSKSVKSLKEKYGLE